MARARQLAAELDEWDTLAAALNRYGIRHLAPHVRTRKPLPEGEELIRQLFSAGPVRLQEATIPLLITHPDLDVVAQRAIGSLNGKTRQRAMYRYVAASALQRMWITRLRGELGPCRLIAPAYLDELNLPSLDLDFGRAALVALSNREEAEYGYDAWAGYSSLMDLFLAEVVDPAWGRCDARLRRTRAD